MFIASCLVNFIITDLEEVRICISANVVYQLNMSPRNSLIYVSSINEKNAVAALFMLSIFAVLLRRLGVINKGLG